MASPLGQILMQAQMSGTPQQPFHATVAPTDFEKANADYNNAMMQSYAAKLGQQNAMWGGLAGLGSAGISTLPKLLGGSGGAAGGASALADGSAIPGAIGATSVGGAPLVAAGADAAGAAGADALGTVAAGGIGDLLSSLGPLAFLAL